MGESSKPQRNVIGSTNPESLAAGSCWCPAVTFPGPAASLVQAWPSFSPTFFSHRRGGRWGPFWEGFRWHFAKEAEAGRPVLVGGACPTVMKWPRRVFFRPSPFFWGSTFYDSRAVPPANHRRAETTGCKHHRLLPPTNLYFTLERAPNDFPVCPRPALNGSARLPVEAAGECPG